MPRNIIVSGLICTVAMIASASITIAAEDDTGFQSIFDGKTLNGWDGDPEHWRVEDGAITGQATVAQAMKNNNFIIWRNGEVDDFELLAEYRIQGGNSGIQYRSFEVPEAGKWVVGGYQADLDAADEWSGALYGERYRGILAAPGEKTVIGEDHKPTVADHLADRETIKALIHKGDWNEYKIIARGNHSVHKINGRITMDCTDNDAAMRRRGGILALQLHAGFDMKVQFRNIRLKRLPMQDSKKIVFIAGPPTHGYGAHEHYAGCQLLAKALNDKPIGVYATVYHYGWPSDPTAFDNANAAVIYANGDDGTLSLPHLKELTALARKGLGVACLHYAVEVPKGEPGDAMLGLTGGYFETFWSINPHWLADFKQLPGHPITRGVQPFSIADEWYYNMRFNKDMVGVTPILIAVPPDETRRDPDDAHGGNAYVRSRTGASETVAWAYDRAATGGVGRGFGFTGGHAHWNWANDDFRKLVLNAIVWTAGADVPPDGVVSQTPTFDEIEAHQDEPQPKDFDLDAVRKLLQSWSKASTTSPG